MESFTDTVMENFTGTVLKTLHKFKYSRIQIFLFIIPFCKLNESWYQICAWILSIKRCFLKKVSYRVCQKSIAQKIWKYVQSNFIKITLRHECSPVNLLHIFRASVFNNISGRLLLDQRLLVYSLLEFKRFL